MFVQNVGSLDRAFRVILGAVMLFVFFSYPDAGWRYWMLLGLVPLLTGLFGTCALYSLLGLNTRSGDKA